MEPRGLQTLTMEAWRLKNKTCKPVTTLWWGAGSGSGFKWKLWSGFAFKWTGFLCDICNTTSFAAPQIILCRRMLGLNPGLLWLWHWQSDALTIRLNLIHIQKIINRGLELKNRMRVKCHPMRGRLASYRTTVHPTNEKKSWNTSIIEIESWNTITNKKRV